MTISSHNQGGWGCRPFRVGGLLITLALSLAAVGVLLAAGPAYWWSVGQWRFAYLAVWLMWPAVMVALVTAAVVVTDWVVSGDGPGPASGSGERSCAPCVTGDAKV